MIAEEYVEKVVAGELDDPALNAHLEAGYAVKGVHMGCMRDHQSLNYATLIEMPNPGYRERASGAGSSPCSTCPGAPRSAICGRRWDGRPSRFVGSSRTSKLEQALRVVGAAVAAAPERRCC